MYNASADFFTAVKANTRQYYWSLTVTTSGGSVYSFNEDKIVKGSGSILSQCCGSDELELGGVYSSELNVSLISDIDRYTLEDARIDLYFSLRLSSGIYETIPMGIFYVSEAGRTGACIEITAYDNMLRFEKAFTAFETVATAYNILKICCDSCGVELDQTEAEINAMTNGTEVLSFYSDNDIETCRDVIHYVGQVLGGFSLIGRNGKLIINQYKAAADFTVDTIHRYKSNFSDFITTYTAVCSTNLRTMTSEYYHLASDTGLTMNLGANPLLQFESQTDRSRVVNSILNKLSTISYQPFTSETTGNPALDVGDVLRFTGGKADSSKTAVITYSLQKIKGRQRLKCVGKNPRLATAKSKGDKNLSGLISHIETGRSGFCNYVSPSALTVGSSDVKIISMEFTAGETDTVQLQASVVMEVTPDQGSQTGVCELYLTLIADNETLSFHPEETWEEGKHTLSFFYPLSVNPSSVNVLNVYCRISGGTGSIGAGSAVAGVSGQGVEVSAAWDGNITIAESTGRIVPVSGVVYSGSITENVSVSFDSYGHTSLSDTLAKPEIGGFGEIIDT